MDIDVTTRNLGFLEAFASETRVRMIEMLNEKPMNIKEMASRLGLSSAIVTKHVQKLEECGILQSESIPGQRGMQKVCSVALEQATLRFKPRAKALESSYTYSIPVGQYTAYQVQPTCGLASNTKIIGMVDDPRYFADPEHIQASLLWFGSGWVEYRVPNYLLGNQRIHHLEISLEICSEAPGYNENWPSDIVFSINGIELGTWTCPGDFGSSRGIYTPLWWNMGTQHGVLKTLILQDNSTFIDGIKLSDTGLSNLDIHYQSEILFRISSPENAVNPGGISLFGKGFGNYNQNIVVQIDYQAV